MADDVVPCLFELMVSSVVAETDDGSHDML